MEKDLMYKIYNTLFDSKNELGIKDLQIYYNLEQQLCVKYKYEGEYYFIIFLQVLYRCKLDTNFITNTL